MGRYLTTTGTAGNTVREISGAYSAVVNDRILANTASSGFTITLPANSTLFLNDTIQIIDVAGNAAINNITIARNSSKINNIADDFVIDVNYAVITLIYTGSTYGWIVANA
jgi:methionine salvage enolase-phosphatase E1